MTSDADVRQSLRKTAANAKSWFLSTAILKERKDYVARGKLGDDGSGAVYVYFDKSGAALYVGEAGRPIKRRMHDQEAPHKKTKWWISWKNVRFLQVRNRTDRLVLELLLILAFMPRFNLKPGARELDAMFKNET